MTVAQRPLPSVPPVTGYCLLLVAVAALYLCAWLFATRMRILAYVGLTLDAGLGEA